MKKLLYLCLALVLVFALCACGDPVTTGTVFTNGTEPSISNAATEATQHTHVFSQWTEEKTATCTEDGLKKRSCACGEVEIETVAALGHQYGENGLCNSCHELNKTAWKAAFAMSAFDNVTLSGSVDMSDQSKQTNIVRIAGDSVHLWSNAVYSDRDPIVIDETFTGREAVSMKEDMLSDLAAFAEEYAKFSYNSEEKVYELQEDIVYTEGEGVWAYTIRYTSCELGFDENGRLISMIYTGCVNDHGETIMESKLTFTNYGTTVITE